MLSQVYALVFISSYARKPCQGWTAKDGGASGTWKVSDYTKGVTRFPRDCVAEKGRSLMDLFCSLEFPDGIICTLGVHPGTLSQ